MSDKLGRNIIVDGGSAATLGRPDARCADDADGWALDHAREVGEAHASFARAGAQILLTETRHTLPSRRSDWGDLVGAAIALARRAPGAPQVWATVGPASAPGAPWAAMGFDDRARAVADFAALAARCAANGVDGFALQSFVDPIECAAAVRAVAGAVPGATILASLTPRDDGRLADGSDPAKALVDLRQAGASWVGFNCGTGPESIEAAVALAPEADWARPARGTGPTDAFVDSLVRLAARVRFVGGCCGVDAAIIARLDAATNHPFPKPEPTALGLPVSPRPL